MKRVTLWRMNAKSRSRRCATLAMSPVSRLSIPTTEWPRASRVSHRCEPMKPAAPVTTVRGMCWSPGGSERGDAPLEQDPHQRQPDDLEVERHRPVFDVVEIVLEPLLERG